MKINVKKLVDTAVMPIRGTSGAGAYDLAATSREYDGVRNQVKYHTGLAIEIPTGYVGLLLPRSSVCKTSVRLSNCVGVIDSDYRGEIMAVFDIKMNTTRNLYKDGERCCQLLIIKAEEIDFVEAAELSQTDRGEKGYGSTGNQSC